MYNTGKINNKLKINDLNIQSKLNIDDFEASRTSIDIKNMGAWKISSIPMYQEDIFLNAPLLES